MQKLAMLLKILGLLAIAGDWRGESWLALSIMIL